MSIGRNPTLNEPEKQFTNAKKASLGLLIITNSLLLLMHSSFIQWPLGKVRLYFNQFPMKVGNTLTTTGLIIKHTGLVIVLSVIYGLFKLISECSDSIPVGNNDSIAGVELDYTNRPEKSQEDSNHDLPILTSSKIIPTIPKADENESPSRASKEMIDYGLYPKALFSNFVKILPTIALSKPIDEKVESIINDKPGTRTTDMLASTDIARKDTEYSKEEGAFSKIKAQNQLESSDKRPEQSQIGRENGELIERQSISGGEQYNSSLARHDKEDVEKPLESQKLLNKSNGFIGNQFLSSEKDDPATFAVEPSKLSSSHSVKASPRYSEREYAATTARALFGMASFAFSTIAKQVGLANDGNQTPSTGSIKDIEIESAKNDPVAKGSQNNRREIPADEGNGGINTSSGTSHHHSVPFPELDNVNLDLPNLQHRNEAKGELPVKPQPLLEIKEYDHTVGSDSPRMIKKTNDSDCLESCIKTTTKPLAAIQTITPPVSNHEEPLQILHANLQNEIMDHGDKRIVRPVKESEISIDIVQSNPKSVFDDIVKVENPKALPDIPIFQVNNSSTEFGKNIRENGSKSIDWIDLVQFEDSRIDPLSKSSPSSPTPEPKNNEHILLESSTNSSDVPPSFSSNKRIETNDASSVGESKSRFSIIKMFSRSKKRKKLVPNTNLVNWGPGSSFRDPNSVAPKKTVRFLEPVDSEHSIEVESSDISIVSKISNNDAYQSNNLDIRDSEVGSISDASETTADDNQTVQNPPFEDTEFKANLFPEPRKFPHLELALFDYEQIDPQQEKFYFNIDRWVDMIDVNGKFAFLPQLESNCNAEANVQFLQPAIPTQSPVPMHAITETNMEPVSLNFSFANLGEIPMAPIFTQHVIELMLDGNGIVNVPSAMFAPLQSHLIVLNLSNNLLTSLPAEIGLLTSLKFLYLRQNRLHQVVNF